MNYTLIVYITLLVFCSCNKNKTKSNISIYRYGEVMGEGRVDTLSIDSSFYISLEDLNDYGTYMIVTQKKGIWKFYENGNLIKQDNYNSIKSKSYNSMPYRSIDSIKKDMLMK